MNAVITKKSKILKTNRVRFLVDGKCYVIYVSSKVASDIRGLCVRVTNNIQVPRKDKNGELVARLYWWWSNHPEQFANSAKALFDSIKYTAK